MDIEEYGRGILAIQIHSHKSNPAIVCQTMVHRNRSPLLIPEVLKDMLTSLLWLHPELECHPAWCSDGSDSHLCGGDPC